MPAKAKFEILDEGDIRRIDSRGLYDDVLVDAHIDALRTALSRRRAAGRAVRVLVDLTHSIVQRPEIAHKLAAATRPLYLADDRVAVLCPSVLHALQVRRANAGHERFVTASRDEALAYLRGAT